MDRRDGSLRIPALSGGGAGGAFGAGALVGISHRDDRPRFDLVTRVSTGALIAPFAFLGPEWDSQLEAAFISGRTEKALSIRGLLGLLLGGGARRSAALTSLVDHFITTDLVEAVAREGAAGQILLGATTELDKEEPVIWNLGRIAARGGERVEILRMVVSPDSNTGTTLSWLIRCPRRISF
jgi:hypothetical protein